MLDREFPRSISAGIETIQSQWPQLQSPSHESPVFVLAAGWRSGSTLLQRLLISRWFIWGEPYEHSGLIQSLSDPLRAFTSQWPEPHFFYAGQDQQALSQEFIANLYPTLDHMLEAHLRFFEGLFIEPARQAGAENWGLKAVRLSADHATYLKWLFPRAKLLFLYRDPFDAYRSYAARRAAGWKWYHRWPDQPVTAASFGRQWRELVSSFFAESKRLGALVVRYEDLAARRFDEIEQYLGVLLPREIAELNPHDGGPPPLQKIAEHERIELTREVGPLAEQLGYDGGRGSHPIANGPQNASPDPKKCVVLVPVGNHIEPQCDDGLRQLESRGYTVRRVRGYAAIDQGRNQMATDALADGFEELFWIDSDVAFNPDDVERLRSHRLPIVCGIYPKKGVRALSCHVMPGTNGIVFGEGGGLVEVLYAATGFLLVRREVLLDIQEQLSLPLCNEVFGRPMLPFFLPLVNPEPTGHWYLAEDYAFSKRARDCGYQIWADTTIRLRHIGTYGFSWEDAGLQLQRFPTFHLHMSGGQPQRQPSAAFRDGEQQVTRPFPDQTPQLAELALAHSWPTEKPPVAPNPHGWLHGSAKELLASVLSKDTRLVFEFGAWLGQSTRFIAEHAPRAVVLAVDHWRGSREHYLNPEFRDLLPVLYETFLTNCWDYRTRIIPMRMSVSEALDVIDRRGLMPDVVYLDADHAYESVRAELARIRSLFPDSVVVGDDWDWETVRRAAVDVAREQGGVVGVHGTAWRFFGRPKSAQEPPPLLLQTIVSL